MWEYISKQDKEPLFITLFCVYLGLGKGRFYNPC